MIKTIALLIAMVALTVAASGCAHDPDIPLSQKLLMRSIPATDADRNAECAWIRDQIARQNAASELFSGNGNPMGMAILRAQASKNVAAYRSRYDQIQCDVIRTVPTAQIVPQPVQRMTFEQCFAKCRELTDRTEAQCFDSCK